MVETFIADEATLQDGSSNERLDLFGHLRQVSHAVNQPTETSHSIGQGGAALELVDNVAEISATLNGDPPNLECLRVFGSYTDNGDGTYTVSPTDELPTYTFKQQVVSGGGTATLSGFKFGQFTLSIDTGGSISVETEGQALDWDGFDDSETITTPDPAGGPRRFFDATIKADGTAIGSLESFSQDFNRNLESIKGIEDDASGEKRTPTAIVEKLYDGSGNMVVNVENSRAYEEALGDSSSPFTVQDDRSEVNVEVEIDTPAGTDTVTLTGVLFEELSHEKTDDGEKRTVSLSFAYRTWRVDGDIIS